LQSDEHNLYSAWYLLREWLKKLNISVMTTLKALNLFDEVKKMV